jgi:hypothetical protein
MTKLSAYGFAFAACFGTMAMLANSNGKVIVTAGVEARYAADGAFRDGLYLGKLAAAGGQPPRIAIGRWNTERDRAMFSAGYQRGYDAAFTENAFTDH